jgi:hypothetical protein
VNPQISGPKPLLEPGQNVFQGDYYRPVEELLFLVRESPQLTKEIFMYIHKNTDQNSPKDDKTLELLALMFFDNLFNDTSKTADSNLQHFNLL